MLKIKYKSKNLNNFRKLQVRPNETKPSIKPSLISNKTNNIFSNEMFKKLSYKYPKEILNIIKTNKYYHIIRKNKIY